MLVFWLGVCLLGTRELLAMLRTGGYHPIPWVVYAGNAGIIGSNGLAIFLPSGRPAESMEPSGWPLLAIAAAVSVAFMAEISRFRRPGGVTANLSAAVFCFVYLGLLASCVAQLRLLGDSWEGLLRVVSLVAVVKAGDTGAYIVGRLTGRHKMAPHVSPKKTIEGAWGALGAAMLAAIIVFGWVAPQWTGSNILKTSWWMVAVYGVALGIAGMIGDLAESLLKRDCGQKDSGNVLPGFGGVLDVLDSILLSAPLAYVFWLAGLVRA